MLFQNEEASLQLEIFGYEFPAGGAPESDDANWLILRGLYREADGLCIRDSNSCLLTYELQEMTLSLKVVCAGLKPAYESDFQESYFHLSVYGEEDHFRVEVSFALLNTMEDLDTAEITAIMTHDQLHDLVDELDGLAKRFPPRS